MNLWQPPDAALCTRLTLTLGHFLWQGLAVAMLGWAANRALRRSSPQARYLVCLGGLAVMALCLPATFLVVSGQRGAGTAVKETAGEPSVSLPKSDTRSASPAVAGEPDVAAEQGANPSEMRQMGNLPHTPASSPTEGSRAASPRWEAVSRSASALYLAGVVAMLARLLAALRARSGCGAKRRRWPTSGCWRCSGSRPSGSGCGPCRPWRSVGGWPCRSWPACCSR